MLPEIGKLISKHFYNNSLARSRTEGNGLFEHFAWLTYDFKDYFAPPLNAKTNKRRHLLTSAKFRLSLIA